MISKPTYDFLYQAVSDASKYSSGAKRKALQAVYDKMLDEISNNQSWPGKFEQAVK